MMSLMTTTNINNFCANEEDDAGGGGGDGIPLSSASLVVSRNYAESETEDEEVKMNCIGGVRGMEDSDICSDREGVDEACASEDEDDDEEEAQSERNDGGVVEFISDRVRNEAALVRPKAISPNRNALSPLEEEEGSDASTVASVGARGVALSLGDDEDDEEDSVDAPSAADDAVDPGYSGEEEDCDDDEDEDVHRDDFDGELSGILESMIGDRPHESSDHDVSESALEWQIGVTLDRDDLITIPKTKRVLSSNTLTALDISRTRNSPKRSKLDREIGAIPLLSSFKLGPPAWPDDLADVANKWGVLEFRRRRESPLVSSSDDEALDRQLEAELGQQVGESRDNSPVPLLTPPQSPVMFEINGDKTTICEWPSNLVVDNAMVSAVNETLVFSPAALADFEKEDVDRTGLQASTLTPLLRGIAVSDF